MEWQDTDDQGENPRPRWSTIHDTGMRISDNYSSSAIEVVMNTFLSQLCMAMERVDSEIEATVFV